MESYICIRCVIPPELEEELPELLAPWSILGTEIDTVPDGRTRATVYLPESDVSGARAVRNLLREGGGGEVEEGLIPADDWLGNYRQQVQPFPVGRRWWIDPHPDRPTAAPEGRQRLVVEPRMAFGTGTHESTRAILTVLEELDVDGRRVLDVGTGSGILALAAESLGAEWVVGLDIDPSAVWVAVEVTRQQEWRSRVRLVLGSVDCLGEAEFDIVVCNMIASNFLPLVGDLRSFLAPAGVAVFSGLLASEATSVCRALTRTGFAITSQHDDGDWASLTAAAVPIP